MEIPWLCSVCNHENMVDLEKLSEWPLDKLMTAEGFTCENCGMREAISYRTVSLAEAERKLARYTPAHPQFRFHFAKILRKAAGVRERGEHLHGESQLPHVAESGPLG